MATGDDVNKTGVSIPVSKVRFTALPLISGNCLYVTATNDAVGSVTFAWGTRYTCFFKAKIFSTPSNAARLMEAAATGQGIILTVTGIKVTQGASNTTSGTVLGINEWHDYAIVYTGDHIRFYRDGAPLDSKAYTTDPYTTATAYTIFNRSDGIRQCDMNVCELQWYNRAFDVEDIATHYRSLSNDTTDLTFRLKLNEGIGTTATDSSGNGLDGTITGCSWTTFDLPHATSTYGDTIITRQTSGIRQISGTRQAAMGV